MPVFLFVVFNRRALHEHPRTAMVVMILRIDTYQLELIKNCSETNITIHQAFTILILGANS